MATISNLEGARSFLAPNGKKLIGKIPYERAVNAIHESGKWVEITKPDQYDSQTTQPTVFVLRADLAFDVPPDEPPSIDPNDVMVHYVGGTEVERFQRVIDGC